MVMFYEEYSSETFASTAEKYLNSEFVQTLPAQIETTSITPITEENVIVQTASAQIVQPLAGQMPKILEMTSLSNHIEILCRCKSSEERLFYILYANKEHLTYPKIRNYHPIHD